MRKNIGAIIASVIALVVVLAATPAMAGVVRELVEDPAPDATSDGEFETWTIMVYICADNDLEDDALVNLDQMEIIGSNDEVKIVVLMDTTDELGFVTETHWYFVEADDNHIDLVTETHVCDCEEVVGGCPGEVNMADGNNLTEFIVAAAHFAPADNYVLILWNHGSGLWGVCWDDSSTTPDDRTDRLTVDELANAIRAAEEEADIMLDMIVFDACLMSMVEVAYEVRDLADYMVASVTGIPVGGLPYHLFLGPLVTNPGMTVEELGEVMVDTFVYYYGYCKGEGIGGAEVSEMGWVGVTLSSIDLSKLEELAGAVDALSYALQDLIESGEATHGDIVYAAQAKTPALEMMGQGFAFPDLSLFASTLADSFPSIAEEAILYVDWTSQTTGGAFVTTGITIYFPIGYGYAYADYSYWTEEEAAEAGELVYWGLDFPHDTNWDEFVLGFVPALDWEAAEA
jgi:hypothetical protein